MSIFWSLVNVSKGQRFTLMLCVLGLIGVNSTTDNSTQEINATTIIGTSSDKTISSGSVPDPIDVTMGHQTESYADDLPRQDGEKDKMQGSEPKTKPPTVLISLLALGLVCAGGLLGATYHSYKKSRTPPCRRLNEEADARDHDSVRFSAASEGQADKPKQNGEAQEKEKTSKDAASAEAGERPAKKGKEEGDTEL
ncbi:uncharacterized protein LOC132380946 isoform X2 [Hypanus sabinus]|uniref:uncharacterized protein LOC132380946 isoform X2 n=1 Tax=Hypanus sabinus TaxID=79690 RepID=UPI0028C50BF2|nr:uncharacterized protein LOC132380946 isoform X2 [Hypanus sabinus]